MRSLPTALFTAPLLLLATASPLAGCATSAPEGEPGAIEGEASREEAFRVDGVVVVERLRTGDASQTAVSAKFMRHVAPGTRAAAEPNDAGDVGFEAAERLVGTRLMLPAPGECASVALLEEADAQDAANSVSLDSDVELIDVGDVALVTDLMFPAASLEGGGSRSIVRLAPRAFPDVGDVVSGVFYTSPDAAAPLPAPALYAIESSGASAVDKFELRADAPAEPADVRVAGTLLGDAATSSGKPMARRGADLLISWGRDTSYVALPSDRVYVDVQAEAGAVHRCTFEDNGEALLPGALVDGRTIAVAVHRLREVTMPMPAEAMADDGVRDEPGRAVVRFDLAVVGRVDVR